MRSKKYNDKYNLADEFKSLRHVKLPLIKTLAAPMQALMRMYPCMPTEEVRVGRIDIEQIYGVPHGFELITKSPVVADNIYDRCTLSSVCDS